MMQYTRMTIGDEFISTLRSLSVKIVLIADLDSLVFNNDYNVDDINEHSDVEVIIMLSHYL